MRGQGLFLGFERPQAGVPSEPPPSALFTWDFVTATYSEPLATSFDDDLVFGPNNWDPASIVPGSGLPESHATGGNEPIFIGAPRTAMLGGCTIVIEYMDSGGFGAGIDFQIVQGASTTYMAAEAQHDNTQALFGWVPPTTDFFESTADNTPIVADAVNKIGISIGTTASHIAYNGAVSLTKTYPATSFAAMDTVWLGNAGGGWHFIRKISVYSFQGAAMLSTLTSL